MLQRDAVGLDDVSRVLAEALPRDLEGAGARALRPVIRVHVERFFPPAQTKVRIQRPEPARVVHDLRALASGGHGVSSRDGRRRARSEHAQDRDHGEGAPKTSSRACLQRAAETDDDEKRHHSSSDERERAEDGAVGDTVRARRHVLGQRRPREGPQPDEQRRPGRRHEEEARLQTLPADDEPEREHDDADHHTGAREREQQRERRDVHEQRAENPNRAPMPALGAEPEAEHDRDVGEDRERVPVAHRLAQPRDAISLGVERRNGLREQRPGERRAEHE